MQDYPLYKTDTEAGLIADVKVALDENVSSEELASLHDLDTLTIDEIIRSKVEDAARLVHLYADHSLLNEGMLNTATPATKTVGGWKRFIFTLPDDFLRLVTANVTGWDYPVTEAIDESHPNYAQQFSSYGGIHGNPQHPVACIVRSGNQIGDSFGKRQLVLFSVPSSALNASPEYSYIPRPEIHTNDNDVEVITLCPRLMRAVVCRTASLAAMTLAMGDAAAALLAMSNTLAGIVTTTEGAR